MNPLANKLAILLLLGVWAALFVIVWNDPGQQFDFKTYYVAAHTYDVGQNPYDVSALRSVARQDHLLAFYYPLSTLQLFRPLGALDYASAHRIWLALKALALIALLVVWKRGFLSASHWPLVLLVTLLAFNAATVWDVKTGNVSVFEQLFLWVGLAFFVAGRMTLFAVCILVASMAKLMPAAFLLLLWLPAVRSRGNAVRFVAGAVAVAALALVPFIANADYLDGFARGLVGQPPRFVNNPTMVGLIDELSHRHDWLASGWVHWALVAGWYAALVGVSLPLLRDAFRHRSRAVIVLVAALAYAIFAPRLIVYSYMIAIVPALVLLPAATERRALRSVALVVALCIGGLAVLPGAGLAWLGAAAPLILLVLCWVALIDLHHSGGLAEAT